MTGSPVPLVSIIIPVHNSAPFLISSVESVLRQTYENIEVLLVDDGSTDGSSDICAQFEAKDPRVSVLRQTNGGPSAARNTGIRTATGSLLQFVDSDDLLEPHATETLVNAIERDQADLVVCSARFVVSDGETLSTIRTLVTPNSVLQRNEFLAGFYGFLQRGLIVPLWNKLYRLDAVRSHEISFNENWRVGEDGAFDLDYARSVTRVAFTSEILYSYRLDNSTSIMSSPKPGYFDGMIERNEKLRSFLLATQIFDEKKDDFFRSSLASLHGAFINLHSLHRPTRGGAIQGIREIVSNGHAQEYARFAPRSRNIELEMLRRLVGGRKVGLLYLIYGSRIMAVRVVRALSAARTAGCEQKADGPAASES